MATRQYIGARYIPKIVGDWDNTKEYEPLMIVYYNGASYTSKTYIPAGIDISNTTYWALSADYNAQVAAYRAEVLAYTDFLKGIFVTPEDYGAVGDGVTDDTDAIQAAIDDCKVVYFHNATYAIDIEKHITPKDGSVLIIDNATLFGLPAANPSTNTHFEPIIDVIDVSDVVIIGNNGVLDGNRDNQPSGEWASGIRITHSNNIRIENLYIKDCHGDGIEIYRFNTNIIIDHIICDSNYRQGLTIGGVEGCVVSNSIFNNTSGTAPSAGIDLEVEADYRAINVSIDNCSFDSNAYGILVASKTHTDTGYTVRNVSISNCTIINSTDAGLRLECKDGLSVSNCSIKNSVIGIWLRYSDGITVDNCVCDGNTSHGVMFMYTEHSDLNNCIIKNNDTGIYLTSGNKYCNIKNNSIFDNTSEGIKAYAASSDVKNEYINISGNIIYNNRIGRSYAQYSAEVDILNYFDNVLFENNIINQSNSRTACAVHFQNSSGGTVVKNILSKFADDAIETAQYYGANIIDSEYTHGNIDPRPASSSCDDIRALCANDRAGVVKHFALYWSSTSTDDGLVSQSNLTGFVVMFATNQYIARAWDAEGREYKFINTAATWTQVT